MQRLEDIDLMRKEKVPETRRNTKRVKKNGILANSKVKVSLSKLIKEASKTGYN